MTRSVRDIDNNKRRHYLYTIGLPKAVGQTVPSISPPVECHPSIKWRLPSPSGEKIAILRQEDSDKDNDDSPQKQILEIWIGQALERRIALSEAHGNVISDPGGFGRPSWNADETVLVYAAERKAPETVSFFDDAGESDEKAQKSKVRGGQFTLGIGKYENWGEKYGKQNPLLDLNCVNVITGKVARVENVPGGGTTDTTEGGYALGQPVFAPDGTTIVYVAFDAGGGSEMPRRLGLIYCQQRPSKLYSSSVEHLLDRLSSEESNSFGEDKDADFVVLSPDLRLARSPRFAPMDSDGKSTLVFVGSEVGFDTHSGCFALHAIDWSGNDAVLESGRVIVKEVVDPRQSPKEWGEVNGLRFPGLFLHQLHESCFVSPDALLITTQWGCASKLIRVSLLNGEVSCVPCGEDAESCALVCLAPDGSAVVTINAPNSPAKLSLMPASGLITGPLVGEGIESLDLITMKPIASTRFSSVSFQHFPFGYSIDVREPPQVTGVDFDLPIQSVLLMPKAPEEGKPPLIVVPHGGPHSVSGTNYLHSYAFLCGHGGYAVLMVNYRGSTGFGQGGIQALPRRIGTLDVHDVVYVTKQVRDSGLIDPERIGICGGSHGGFVTAHCTSRYPDLFKVAAVRNPVVNIPSMTTATDSEYRSDFPFCSHVESLLP